MFGAMSFSLFALWQVRKQKQGANLEVESRASLDTGVLILEFPASITVGNTFISSNIYKLMICGVL
jgi:hypothetical protein